MQTYKKTNLPLISVIPLLVSNSLSTAVFAQEIPEIIVTATRTAETVDETIAPVTIITRKDIERTQASSVSEVLRTSVGISFTSNGGFGSVSGINLRGTNTNHVLYLIDGVPIGSASSGTTAIEYLPISQVERIEIVRGPRSSLYGSNAIGGVIQIFTNKSSKKKATASIGYGTDNSKEVTASYADGNDSSQFSGGFSVFDGDGYDFYGRDSYGIENKFDGDDDGYKNYSVSLNGSHKLTQNMTLSGLFLRTQGESEFDGYSDTNTHTEFTEQVMSGTVDFSVTEDWQTKLTLARSYDKQHITSYKLPAKGFYFVEPTDYFNTKTDNVIWQNDIIVRDLDLLTLGLDYKEDKVDSSNNYAQNSRWNQAFYSQYSYNGDVFTTQLSWRYDDNEAFGSHNTWNIGTGFSLDKNVRITSSYGTAFKAPTFNDLYWPADAFFAGNPDLKPEESRSFDFGVEITTGETLWTAHYFDTRVDNLITYVSSWPGVSMMENVNKANIDGFELSVATNLLGWTVSANASFIDPIDESTGKMLPRRSKYNFNLALDNHSGAFSYGASVLASSERYNRTDEREQLSGFALMNIRASYEINKQWSIKAKVDNLFDKEYVLSKQGGFNYYQQGRFIFTSIHYQM